MSLMEQARLRLAGMEAPLLLAVLGLFCGLFAGIVIVIFRFYTDAVVLIWFQDLERVQDFESLPWELRLVLPIIGGVVIGIVFHLLPNHLRSIGVRHVVERLAMHEGHLPMKNAIVQFFTGGFALTCGLPVGREGPAIHLGSAVSSMTGKQLHLPNNSQRILVGCGTAAAIAACFNTPLAGVIFALEVVMLEYTIASFIPIILAAVSSTVVARIVFGNDVAYSVPALDMISMWEIPAIVLLGLIGGVWSAGFITLTEKIAQFTSEWPRWVRPSLAGILVGGLALVAPEIMGPGYDTVSQSFHGELAFSVLLLALLAKTVATAFCGGLSVPGGAIGPSLFIGAALGGVFGYGMDAILPGDQSYVGFYAMLGLATLMSATLYAPLAALMALLELTGNPNIIMPGMLSVVLANLVVSHAFHKRSIIQTMLAARGVETRISPLMMLLRRISIGKLLDTSIVILDRKLTRVEAESILKSEPRWLLIKENNWPSELMHAGELAAFLLESEQDDIDLMEIPAKRENMVSVHLQATLAEALESMNEKNVDAAYVYHRGGTDRIIGVVTRGKIEHYYTYRST